MRTLPLCDGRFAQNQPAHAQVNAVVDGLRPPYTADDELRFLCECSRGECAERVVMTAGDYAALGRDIRRFAVAPGHDDPIFEIVVEQHDRYWVVEKFEPPA